MPTPTRQPARTLPAVDKFWFNTDSRNIYLITHVSAGARVAVARVSCARVGDSQTFQLPYHNFVSKYQPLTDEQVEAVQALKPNYERQRAKLNLAQVERFMARSGETDTKLGYLITPTDKDTFDRLVLHDRTLRDVMAGYRQVINRERLEAFWRLSDLAADMMDKCAMNFWGPPGTGKTATARALARKFDKNLLAVDYSQMISCIVGDTAKNIAAIFEEARANDAILFFDEADSLLSRRVTNLDQAFAASVNQNRNVLMQEMDKFRGVVIFTTNMFTNYDEAIIRRIAKHVEFPLPDRAMRQRILCLHLPLLNDACQVTESELEDLANLAEGLSGGELRNCCLNAVLDGSEPDEEREWLVTSGLISEQIENYNKLKNDHRGLPDS